MTKKKLTILLESYEYQQIMDYKERKHLSDGDLATIGDIVLSNIK